MLVRDVLGREPLFVDGDLVPAEYLSVASHEGGQPTAAEWGDHVPGSKNSFSNTEFWAYNPAKLSDPVAFPPGCTLSISPDGGLLEPQIVWELPSPAPATPDRALERLHSVLGSVLTADRTSGAGSKTVNQSESTAVAVAFSGGIDSALVATGHPEAPLYVTGFEGSHDIDAARNAAAAMNRSNDLRVIELTHDSLRRHIPSVVEATGRTNAMDVSIALPLFIVAERAAADGYDSLAIGQGADELFGGYSKVTDPASDHRVDASTVRGAVRETILTLPDQLARDVPVIRQAGIDFRAPFLQDRVVDAALRLPDSLLVDGTKRKVALRQFAATTQSIPRSVRTAEKKALQYGTYVSRELDRLARQHGFKRRMDRHVDRYIESLLS